MGRVTVCRQGWKRFNVEGWFGGAGCFIKDAVKLLNSYSPPVLCWQPLKVYVVFAERSLKSLGTPGGGEEKRRQGVRSYDVGWRKDFNFTWKRWKETICVAVKLKQWTILKTLQHRDFFTLNTCKIVLQILRSQLQLKNRTASWFWKKMFPSLVVVFNSCLKYLSTHTVSCYYHTVAKDLSQKF